VGCQQAYNRHPLELHSRCVKVSSKNSQLLQSINRLLKLILPSTRRDEAWHQARRLVLVETRQMTRHVELRPDKFTNFMIHTKPIPMYPSTHKLERRVSACKREIMDVKSGHNVHFASQTTAQMAV
jgi:hypothetical protein